MSTPEDARATGEHANRFIAILGHELRGRLAPMKNVADLLQCERLEVATRRDIAGIITRQVTGMTRLIDDLLDMARQRAAQLQVRRRLVSLQDVINHTVETIKPVIVDRGHSLIVMPPPEPLLIECDELWLSQALQNLLGNAAKFSELGGEIIIEAFVENDDAVIIVSDSGIGIAPHDLAAIFDPYVQLQTSSAKSSAGSLGMGLYLVRLIAEAHGGSIAAASRGRDQGSRFVLRLPIHIRV